MAARDDIIPVLINGDIEFSEQDTHRKIAERVIDAGVTDASFVTVRRAIGRWRRGELADYEAPVDDSSSSKQTESPGGDTSDEWTGEEYKQKVKDEQQKKRQEDKAKARKNFWEAIGGSLDGWNIRGAGESYEAIENPESNDFCLFDEDKGESGLYYFNLNGVENVWATFDHVERICQLYPYAGAGYNQNQVRDWTQSEKCKEECGYRLTDVDGNPLRHSHIKRMLWALDFQKTDNPIAPHEVYQRTPAENADKWLSREHAQIEEKYRKKQEQANKDKLEKLLKEKTQAEKYGEKILKADKKREFKTISFSIDWGEKEEVVPVWPIFQDWHIGALVKTGQNQFSKEISEKRVDRLCQQVVDIAHNSRFKFTDSYVPALGDLIDGVVGIHVNQQANQDLHGVEQMHHAEDLMGKLLSAIESVTPGKVYFDAITGNHGRGAKHYKEDPERVPEYSTYHFVKRDMSEHDIEFNISTDPVIERVLKNTQVLIHHGDGRSPRDDCEMVRAHKRNDVDTHLVLSGHLHHLDIKEDLDELYIQLRSIIGQTRREKQELGVGAKPAGNMLYIKDNGPFFPGELEVKP